MLSLNQVMNTDRNVFGAISTPACRLKRRLTHPDHADDSIGRSKPDCGGWKKYADSPSISYAKTFAYLSRIGVSTCTTTPHTMRGPISESNIHAHRRVPALCVSPCVASLHRAGTLQKVHKTGKFCALAAHTDKSQRHSMR